MKSSNYGTALLLYPAQRWSFNYSEYSQRVEDAVFGENNSKFSTKLNLAFNGTAIIEGEITRELPMLVCLLAITTLY